METVIKVSGTKQKEKEKDAEPPPAPPETKPPPSKAKGSWGWHTEGSPPPPMPPPPLKPVPAEGKGKGKDKHKVKEANVESEVDRLIDSQDNVYVLSRPKCVGHSSSCTGSVAGCAERCQELHSRNRCSEVRGLMPRHQAQGLKSCASGTGTAQWGSSWTRK